MILLISFAVAVVVSAEACCEDGVSSNRRVVEYVILRKM